MTSMLLAPVLLFPAFSPVLPSRMRMATPVMTRPGPMTMASNRPVPLTGQTLQAALKIRSDLTGSAYAIYWSEQGDIIQATGVYAAEPNAKSFVEGSKTFTLDAQGAGPVAFVYKTGNTFFIDDVRNSNLKRKELALRYGVSQVALIPFEAGVVEIGNMRTSPQWPELPQAPFLPKAKLRQAFEDLGALYAIYWQPDLTTNVVRVAASYENPRDIALRQALRGDGGSFVKMSKELNFELDGPGPVQEVLRTGKELVVGFDDDSGSYACKSMKRASYAKEFGLCFADFVPVTDVDGVRVGVMEFGVATTSVLNPVTLEATLQMQTQSATAAYGIYWKQEGNTARPMKSFTSPWYKDMQKQKGSLYTFTDISQETTVDVTGPSPLAQAIRTRSKVYVPDMSATNDERAYVAPEYDIASVAYVPVVGGVFEYGVPAGVWSGERDALAQTIPNEEVDAALASGATYMMFWKVDEASGNFRVAASYERAANVLNEAAKDGDSYIKSSAATVLDLNGAGPIATAYRSAATLEVPNTATYPNFRRRDLCMEWGVGKFTCIPIETGVLEFGRVTKDKRETTRGSEYKESSRQYRRTVFMHKEWEDHRSTTRFVNSLTTTLESGVLKGRQDEVVAITAFATFVVVWNLIAGGWTGIGMVKHDAIIPFLPVLALPLSSFTLTGSSLGLLLVFRTNAAYARWDDARKQWGSIINQCRSLVRQANTFFVEDRYPGYGNFRDYRRRVAAETSAFTRCLRCFLRGASDNDNLEVELRRLGFDPAEVKGYMAASNKQIYALEKLGETARCYGMKEQDRARFDQTLSVLCDNVGACERIFKSPIPLVYTRHTSRYVGVWVGLLPLALWSADSTWNHLGTIATSAITAFLLLGIEELGLQIEEPFGILPIEAFCDGAIYPALTESILSDDKRRALEKSIRAQDEPPTRDGADDVVDVPAITLATEAAPVNEPAADTGGWESGTGSAEATRDSSPTLVGASFEEMIDKGPWARNK